MSDAFKWYISAIIVAIEFLICWKWGVEGFLFSLAFGVGTGFVRFILDEVFGY